MITVWRRAWGNNANGHREDVEREVGDDFFCKRSPVHRDGEEERREDEGNCADSECGAPTLRPRSTIRRLTKSRGHGITYVAESGRALKAPATKRVL